MNANLKLNGTYFKKVQPLQNADVILDTVSYAYKDTNGVVKQKSVSDYVYKPFTIETNVTKRNLNKNNLLDKNENAIGSFYVRNISFTIVEFNETQLSSMDYKELLTDDIQAQLVKLIFYLIQNNFFVYFLDKNLQVM